MRIGELQACFRLINRGADHVLPKDEFSIYTVNSARVNIASFNDGNIDYFIDALATVLEEP